MVVLAPYWSGRWPRGRVTARDRGPQLCGVYSIATPLTTDFYVVYLISVVCEFTCLLIAAVWSVEGITNALVGAFPLVPGLCCVCFGFK